MATIRLSEYLTLEANSVTNSKLAQVATGTIKGRKSSGTGNTEDLSAEDVRSLIKIGNFYPNNINRNSNTRYIKLATLDGVENSVGSSISWLLTNVGDYGRTSRQNYIVNIVQRFSNAIHFNVYSLDSLPEYNNPENPRFQLGYVKQSTFVYDIYLKLHSYTDDLSFVELARDRAGTRVTTYYPFTVSTTEPDNLVLAKNLADKSQVSLPVTSLNILQTIGDDQYGGMSQKAITEAITPTPVVISSDTTATLGNYRQAAYAVDTTSNVVTLTLPAVGLAGDRIKICDYAGNFTTNKCTLARNGNNIKGSASDYDLDVSGVNVELVYIDATHGWAMF